MTDDHTPINLKEALPRLLPGAIAWAQSQAAIVADSGDPLNSAEIELARRVEVANPERVRVSIVKELPLPDDPELREAARQTGLLGPGMVGLTLWYSILICGDHRTRRLLTHELRHVHQYEERGSIDSYLPIYLRQIVEYGYHDAPYEVDAREHEVI